MEERDWLGAQNFEVVLAVIVRLAGNTIFATPSKTLIRQIQGQGLEYI